MDFEGDADAQGLSLDSMETIKALAAKQLSLEKTVEDLEGDCKDAKARLAAIQLQQLPQALKDAGVESIDLEDMKIEMIEELKASISKKNKIFAHDWLRKEGHSDLIKNIITIQIPAGSDEQADYLIAAAKEVELQPERSEHVHAGTLKAFCKEMLQEGKTLPEDILGIFRFNKTKVKEKRGN